MLIKTEIQGLLWGWYKWQGYMFKTDQKLTADNHIGVVMEPGQGELGTAVTELDRIIPSTLYAAGTLPETVNGNYVTYLQPQFANWVNDSDVTTWFESIIPQLSLNCKSWHVHALSLGGLALQYFSHPTAKMKLDSVAVYDGYLQGTVPLTPAVFITNCKNLLIVDDLNDGTVNSAANSQALFNALKSASTDYPVTIVNLPGNAHDTWTAAFQPSNKNPESYFQFLTRVTSTPLTVPTVAVNPPAPAQSAGTITLTTPDGVSTKYQLIRIAS